MASANSGERSAVLIMRVTNVGNGCGCGRCRLGMGCGARYYYWAKKNNGEMGWY